MVSAESLLATWNSDGGGGVERAGRRARHLLAHPELRGGSHRHASQGSGMVHQRQQRPPAQQQAASFWYALLIFLDFVTIFSL